MAAKSPKNIALILLFIHACLAVLVPTGLAQLPQIPGLFPFPGLGGLPGPTTQCFSSLVNIPGCLTEVFGSFINGHFGIIGSSCCKAITEIEDNCLGKLFPFNPVFAPLLNSTCGQSSNTGANKLSLVPGLLPLEPLNQDIQQCWSSLSSGQGCITEIIGSLVSGKITLFGPACCKAITVDYHQGQSGQDILQCWSSLTSIEGCINEIYGSLSRGKFGVSGPACCKAITDVSDKCWPKMFPLNPMFPPLLKSNCAPIVGATPTA
uniref:Prolamin-like domain-containing protein n=1 Tax=Fagus sylvatica TaxID=28930 RepID=A0A2N9FUR2_FAGSY